TTPLSATLPPPAGRVRAAIHCTPLCYGPLPQYRHNLLPQRAGRGATWGRWALPLTLAPCRVRHTLFFCVPPQSWTHTLTFNMTAPKVPSRLIKLPTYHCKDLCSFI